MPKTQDELDLKDINFLRAVKELCDNPDEHPETEGGEAPANTTAIKELEWTDFSAAELQYRMSKNKRGFEADGGMGLIRVYDPPITENGYGPRSVEITDQGRRVLSETLEERDLTISGEGATALAEDAELEIAELREEVSRLSREVEEMREDHTQTQEDVEAVAEIVEMWQDQEFGALDPEQGNKLSSVIKALPAFIELHNEIFGVNPKEFGPEESLSNEDYQQKREQVREALEIADRS